LRGLRANIFALGRRKVLGAVSPRKAKVGTAFSEGEPSAAGRKWRVALAATEKKNDGETVNDETGKYEFTKYFNDEVLRKRTYKKKFSGW